MIKREFIFKNNSNKTLLIVAGLHGNEQTSVYAVDELIRNLENKIITTSAISKIIIYNYVNMDGILTNERLCKNLDLNREFSNKISKNKDIEEIKKSALKADYTIDVHSSFNSTEFFFLDNDQYVSSSIAFLNAHRLTYVVSPDPNQNTLKSFINQKGNFKVGFTLELNQNGTNIDVASAIKGVSMITTIIKHINTFVKSKSRIPENIKSITLTADLTGLLKINDVLGKTVERGQKLGYILSLDKNRMVNVLAPCNGKIIVYPSFMTYVAVGTPILTIQPL